MSAAGTSEWIQNAGKAGGVKRGVKCGAQVVQNAVQQPAAPSCMFSQFATQPLAPYDVVHGLATACKTLQSETMGEEGFEPSKAKPTDLQSVLVDHLSTRPSHSERLSLVARIAMRNAYACVARWFEVALAIVFGGAAAVAWLPGKA